LNKNEKKVYRKSHYLLRGRHLCLRLSFSFWQKSFIFFQLLLKLPIKLRFMLSIRFNLEAAGLSLKSNILKYLGWDDTLEWCSVNKFCDTSNWNTQIISQANFVSVKQIEIEYKMCWNNLIRSFSQIFTHILKPHWIEGELSYFDEVELIFVIIF
jgi:hypothetical protein